MKPDDLAKYMRERALLIEGNKELNEQSLRSFGEFASEKARKIKRLEELKKLYFDAGRWAGGARDYAARQAFEKMQVIESKGIR